VAEQYLCPAGLINTDSRLLWVKTNGNLCMQRQQLTRSVNACIATQGADHQQAAAPVT
jgi:hypothetical protein